jgi:DnaK suppressor protein
MPRKNSLTNLRQVLIVRRDALRAAILGDDSLLNELHQQTGGDVVDFANDSAIGELSSQLAEVETRELQQIEQALEKMTVGTYGKCDACKKSIPLARLEALPYASYCINCKRAAEVAGVEPNAVVDWSLILEPANSTQGWENFHLS